MKISILMKPVQAVQAVQGVQGVSGRFTLAALAAAVLIGLAGMTSPPVMAQDSTLFAHDSAGPGEGSLPPVQTQGQAQFLSGGIGKDETDAIKRAAGSWPLVLEFAQLSGGRGAYLSDAKVVIKDAAGTTVLETVADGPYMLVKLPPGKYAVEAVYQSKTLRREASLQKGQSRTISLLWPAPKDQDKAPAGGQGGQSSQSSQRDQGAADR